MRTGFVVSASNQEKKKLLDCWKAKANGRFYMEVYIKANNPEVLLDNPPINGNYDNLDGLVTLTSLIRTLASTKFFFFFAKFIL